MHKLFVGNIQAGTTDQQLRSIFEAFGIVDNAVVVADRQTGRSRGFGFVEMPDRDAAEAAIAAMNGNEFGGRSLTVNHARPPAERGALRGSGRRKPHGPAIGKRKW